MLTKYNTKITIDGVTGCNKLNVYVLENKSVFVKGIFLAWTASFIEQQTLRKKLKIIDGQALHRIHHSRI